MCRLRASEGVWARGASAEGCPDRRAAYAATCVFAMQPVVRGDKLPRPRVPYAAAISARASFTFSGCVWSYASTFTLTTCVA
jgi:hypothetical protein